MRRKSVLLLTIVLITAGCVRPRLSAPVTMDCQVLGMAQVTNLTPRVEITSGQYSLLPPQGKHWCVRTAEPGAIVFSTHPLLGETLYARPSDAEILHSFSIGAFQVQVPEGANVETADDIFAFVKREYLAPEPRFRAVEATFAPDSSLGANCIRFRAIMEERNNPRAPGAVLIGVIGDSFACRHPNSRVPTVVVISPSERYIQGTVARPLLMETLRSEWEPSVRSLQFMPRP